MSIALCTLNNMRQYLGYRFNGNCREKYTGETRLNHMSYIKTNSCTTAHLVNDVADCSQEGGIIQHEECESDVQPEENAELGYHRHHDGCALLHGCERGDALPRVVVHV
jgi:hypothetical protein